MSKKNKNQTFPNKSNQKLDNKNSEVTTSSSISARYSGPLPPASEFEKYEKAYRAEV